MSLAARYNKIQHQYRLTGEQGPAHKKIFTVTLKLGGEEYGAEGPSIKKAQHSAAAMALAKTDYKHPPPKTIRNRPGNRVTTPGVVTPTVELNALAMKRGERTVYMMDNGNAPPHQVCSNNICCLFYHNIFKLFSTMPFEGNSWGSQDFFHSTCSESKVCTTKQKLKTRKYFP